MTREGVQDHIAVVCGPAAVTRAAEAAAAVDRRRYATEYGYGCAVTNAVLEAIGVQVPGEQAR